MKTKLTYSDMKSKRYLSHESAMLPRLTAGHSYYPMARRIEDLNWIQRAIRRTKRILQKVAKK